MRARRASTPLALALALTGLAGLAVACGSTEDGDDASADAPDGETAEPVTVTDARGEDVTLEDGPASRVVALEWMEAENLVTLGVMPVGVADVEGYGTWVASAPLDDSVADVGTRAEPSVDAIVELEPDLVIMEDDRGAGMVEQMERYAPVVVVQGSDTSDNVGQMRENFELIARAVGKEDEAEAILSDFDTKLEEARQAIEAAGAAGTGFVMADGYLQGSTLAIRMFGEGSLMSDLAEAVGLENQWTGEVDPDWGLGETDLEGLTGVGDVHFFYSASEQDVFDVGLDQNPIWASLPFVVDDKLHKLDDGTWTFGGPASSEHFVDQLVATLAP